MEMKCAILRGLKIMAYATMRNFDTLHSFDRLTQAGVSNEQARVFVGLFEDSLNSSMEHLSTKQDVSEAKLELKLDTSELRTELKQDIADVRTEIAELRTELKQDIADVRTEIAELRTELKQDIADVRTEIAELRIGISVLQNGQIFMQRLFFGGILTILVSIGMLFLHH